MLMAPPTGSGMAPGSWGLPRAWQGASGVDGPFAETRELVPGFEAEDFGEAISPETGALERRLRERLKGA